MDLSFVITAAVEMIRSFFHRATNNIVDKAADEASSRVIELIRRHASQPEPVDAAIRAIEQNPDTPASAKALWDEVGAIARAKPDFLRELQAALPPASVQLAHGSHNIQIHNGQGRSRILVNSPRIKSIVRHGSTRGLLIVGGIALVTLIACCGIGYALISGQTSYFDTQTVIQTEDGWKYRVSEAHLAMAGELNKKTAPPGNMFVYFDITVENMLSDRTAPGLPLLFAREASTMPSECGGIGLLGGGYRARVVDGWCVTDPLFAASGSCYNASDGLFKSLDRIPGGGKKQMRCVDQTFATDGFKLDSLRVYFAAKRGPYTSSNLIRIPAKS